MNISQRTVRRLQVLIGIPTAILLTSRSGWADYPIMSHRYLADPGALVFGGKVYLYSSNDDDNAEGGGYTMHSIVCVSTSDLKNWTDHGVVFQVPSDAPWASYSWAPQPIVRNGTIFLYFGNNASGVGVASSTSPTGGFKDTKGSYLVNSSTPGASGTNSWLFDPGAFIDSDGQAYLSFGGNGINNGRIIKLGSDLKSVSGSAVGVTTTSTTQFFEASFLFKRSNFYYFSYSTNPSNGQRIDYLVSSSPMTGYTYGGTIATNPPSNGNNNHASEFEFNGNWYHAYHNRHVAAQAGISTTYKRNLGLEVLNFNSDGTIKQVVYTTNGVPQLVSVDPYSRVEAETMNAQSGIETEACGEGGMDVTQISSGDWVSIHGVEFGTTGASSFSARVASATSGGSIELRLGSATGTLVGTCVVPATGGAQTWANVTCSVTGATGLKDLYLKFTGSGSFNFNYWQFSPKTAGSGGTGGSSGMGGSSGTGGASAGSGASSTGGTGTGGLGGAATSGTRSSTAGGFSAAGGHSSASGSAVVAGGLTSTGGSTSADPTDPLTVGGTNVGAAGGSNSNAGSSGAGLNVFSGSGPSLGGDLTRAGGPSAMGIGGGNRDAIDAPNESTCTCRVPGHPAHSNPLPVFAALGLLLRLTSTRRPRQS